MKRYTKHDRAPLQLDDEDLTPAPAPEPAMAPRPPVDEQTIRVRAYERWEAAGRPEGDGVQFWLEAEKELMAGNPLTPRPAASLGGCRRRIATPNSVTVRRNRPPHFI